MKFRQFNYFLLKFSNQKDHQFISLTGGTQMHNSVISKKDPAHIMKAVEWHGEYDVRVVERPRPLITDPKDVLVHVTSSSICGSDLHLYHKQFPMKEGQVLGHEFMGIIEDIGSEVTTMKVGDRVVVSAIIVDGTCEYCKKSLFSCCDTTNPSLEMEDTYGHRTSGIFGYSALTGNYEGGQAEYVRVPYGDHNCLKVPDELKDEEVLFLGDVLSTAWQATEQAQVKEGDTVAVWGLGPVGLLACMWAKHRKASKVIGVDCVPERLELAQSRLDITVINTARQNVLETIKTLLPGGPDCCIDAVGFCGPEVLGQIVKSVRKGGKIGIIGLYQGDANFPLGAFMIKELTMSSGLVDVQRYWHQLLDVLVKKEVDPTFIITHTMPLERAEEGYRIFDKREDGVVKIILKPSWNQPGK